MSDNTTKEISWLSAIERTLLKYRKLFPQTPIFYQGAEVVNFRTHQFGTVDSISLNELTLCFSDGRKERVPINDIIPAKTYWDIAAAVTMVNISYKGSATPAVLVSEGTFLLPCPYLFEKYSNILALPDRSKLRGVSQERYYEHFRKFLMKISWDGMIPKDIYALTDEEIDVLVKGEPSEDPETGRKILLPPVLTLEKVIDRIKEVYDIEPCDTCTMDKTCDCRMRIVQQITGDKATSYRVAQRAFRAPAEPLAFLLKGVFRGRPRIRFVDYDTWLQNRLDADYDPKWVTVILRAIQIYQAWSGKEISDEVISTLQNTANMIGVDLDELEEEQLTVQR